MVLSPLDLAIMAAFFVATLAIGLYAARQSGGSFDSFFLGGRTLPWWALGISMVATTFSTDTPNLVTDLVRTGGVAANWSWWAFLLMGALNVFIYARLWRRSGVKTDVAFYELRYSGPMARFLRGFRAVYLGVVFNILVMAMVTLAAIKIGAVMFGWSPVQTVVIAAGVTTVYAALGGLRGVVLTDLLQFAFAMVGSVGAAIYVLSIPEIGGLEGLVSHPNVVGRLHFLPTPGTLGMEFWVPMVLMPLAVQWWASYYPASEPGGGGYIVQRTLSARNQKEAVLAGLVFNVAHYALRPWPWILVALASLVVYPELADLAAAFPQVEASKLRHDLAYSAMLTQLPAGLLGIVVTSLSAAYMSTMSTQVNWGASVLVNDVYLRFVKPEASEAEQVWLGRLATVVLMVGACAIALLLENAKQAFDLLLLVGAGTGLIFAVRWIWWRVNALAEIVAMIASLSIAVLLTVMDGFGLAGWGQMLLGVTVTTILWVLACLFGPVTDEATLQSFYARVRPGGPGWEPVARRAPKRYDQPDLLQGLGAAIDAIIGIYATLFATGFALYGAFDTMALWLVIAAIALWDGWRRFGRLQLNH